MNTISLLFASLSLLAISSVNAATIIAADSASDPVYSDGWQHGDNGGFGWSGGWGINSTDGDFHTSTGASGSIDTGGRSWMFTTASPGYRFSWAERAFNDPLGIGDTVSIRFVHGMFGVDGGISVALADSRVFGWTPFIFQSQPGRETYYIDAVGLPEESGIPLTTDPMLLTYTRTGSDAYTLSLSVGQAEPLVFYGSGSDRIDRITIESYSGPNSQNAPVYFNELFISRVPEPSVLGFAATAVSAFIGRRRRTRANKRMQATGLRPVPDP
jgi:hypothetical protein